MPDEARSSHALDSLIGETPVFRRLLRDLPRIAAGDATILLIGETGTGKELFARAIHSLSPRTAGEFVALNCGAIPENLLEDELFGHDRGAFTDARNARVGALTQANRGTLFLDELDTLSPRGQVALLRVLQNRTFRPLGADGERRSDVRFIAASNVDLAALTRSGAFRPDLFYRVSVLTVRLPPLRERRDDITRLAEHFLQLHRPPHRPAVRIGEHAAAVLQQYDWPGNVRELENAILRGIYRATVGVIEPEDLELPLPECVTPASTRRTMVSAPRNER